MNQEPNLSAGVLLPGHAGQEAVVDMVTTAVELSRALAKGEVVLAGFTSFPTDSSGGPSGFVLSFRMGDGSIFEISQRYFPAKSSDGSVPHSVADRQGGQEEVGGSDTCTTTLPSLPDLARG